MAEFNPIQGLIGGILIGLSATILLAWNGRIAGISGIVKGVISTTTGDISWRWLFIVGLLVGGVLYEYSGFGTPTPTYALAPIAMIAGGFLVGFGTSMGNGCTSGHGVCGLGRFSPRSLAAVITFLVTAIGTVYIINLI